jgi:hypothetical protein
MNSSRNNNGLKKPLDGLSGHDYLYFEQTKGFIPMIRKYDNISVISSALLPVSVLVVLNVVVGDVIKDAP